MTQKEIPGVELEFSPGWDGLLVHSSSGLLSQPPKRLLFPAPWLYCKISWGLLKIKSLAPPPGDSGAAGVRAETGNFYLSKVLQMTQAHIFGYKSEGSFGHQPGSGLCLLFALCVWNNR